MSAFPPDEPFGPPPTAPQQPPPYPAGPGYQQHGYGYAAGATAEAAGFWIRFGAYLLDGFLISIPVYAVVLLAPDAAAVVNLIALVGGVLYYSLLEGGPRGQTLGKRAMGIRVVDKDTYQPGIGTGRGVGRYFARILSAIPLGLGYFWMLWDKDSQCWHDKLVNDRVVKVPPGA